MANETLKLDGSIAANEAEDFLRQLAERHLYGVLRLDGSAECSLIFIDGGLVLDNAERPEDRIANQGGMRQLLHPLVDGKGFIGSYVIEPVVDHESAHSRPRFDLLAFLGEGNSSTLPVRTVAVAPESSDTAFADPASPDAGSADTATSDTGSADTATATTGSGDTGSGDTEFGDTGTSGTESGDTAETPVASPQGEVTPPSDGSPQPGGRREGDPPERGRPMNPSNPDRPLRASQLRALLQHPVEGGAPKSRPPQPGRRAADRPAPPRSGGPTRPNRPARSMPQTVGPKVRTSDRSARGSEATPETETTDKEPTERGQPNRRRALGRLIRTLAG